MPQTSIRPVERDGAEQGHEQLALAVPLEAGDAQHLALVELEVDAAQQMPDRQSRRP